jgi:hypothetical protein
MLSHRSINSLGTTLEIIEKLIAWDAKAMSKWEEAWDLEPRAAPNPTGTNQYTKAAERAKEVKPDNILPNQNQQKSVTLEYGNSALAGLRRLRKASEAGDEKAMLAWDQAVRGEHGGAHNPEGIGGKSGKQADIVNVDNIHVDNKGTVRPAGTSTDAGLRRLDKAAQAGDEKAADMLRRVLDPNDPTTVNSAAVIMGWRKP